MTTQEQLIQEIHDRMAAMGELVSEQRITQLVTDHLDKLVKDEAFVRKMRFGGDGAEPKLVGTKYARFGLSLADVEFLFDLQLAMRGMKRVDGGGIYEGPSEELRNTFEAISQAIYLPDEQVREIDRRAIDNVFPRIPLSWFHERDQELAGKGKWELTQAYKNAIRAMDTAESGFGAQLVGQQYVRELWEAARAESRIFGTIGTFEMMDPTAFLPVEVDIPEMLFVAERTGPTDADYATKKTGSQRVQVDAKKFIIHQVWSGEMEEDSIIPYIPFLRRQATLSLAHYSDSLELNGDTTNLATGNINLDDADPADDKHYLAFDGIRHAGLVDNTANSKDAAGAVTFPLLREIVGRLIDAARFVDWGHPRDAGDVIHVADPETADRIATLDEVLKYKQLQNVPLLNGESARILGRPVISSMAMSKTEADGKVSTTPANNTKGQVATYNRRGFVWGWRRRVKLETERLPGRDQTRLIYSLRSGFGRFTPTGAASGIEAADVLYNITL